MTHRRHDDPLANSSCDLWPYIRRLGRLSPRLSSSYFKAHSSSPNKPISTSQPHSPSRSPSMSDNESNRTIQQSNGSGSVAGSGPAGGNTHRAGSSVFGALNIGGALQSAETSHSSNAAVPENQQATDGSSEGGNGYVIRQQTHHAISGLIAVPLLTRSEADMASKKMCEECGH